MEKRSLLTGAGEQPASVVSAIRVFHTDVQQALEQAGYELGWKDGMTGITGIRDLETRRDEYLQGYDRGHAAARHYRTTPMLRYGALEYNNWYWMKRDWYGSQSQLGTIKLIVYKGGNRYEYTGNQETMEELDRSTQYLHVFYGPVDPPSPPSQIVDFQFPEDLAAAAKTGRGNSHVLTLSRGDIVQEHIIFPGGRP